MIPSYVYKKVRSITFGILGPEDIKKMSAGKVVTAELYDKEGYPVDGGLMDTHLGVIDPGLRCKTCGGKLKECTGHFGHIELARPVIHIKYIKTILDCLRSTCRLCNRILLTDDDRNNLLAELDKMEKEHGMDAKRRRIKEIIAKLKNLKKCPHCNEKQYTVKIEKPSSFLEKDKKLNPIEVRTRLEKIPDEDCEVLGVNPKNARPEWAILTYIPIPPVTIRPSITLETGERSEDDLTHKLGDIVRINQRLFENINAGAPEIIIEDLWDLLQYHITTYFDNNIAQIPPARHRSGQPLKTITERIKSKEGRFRHNLAGKRVNFASRAVISPDPTLNFNEVGIPKEVAMELTVPERVTDWNKKYLIELIKKGPINYPGANYVIRPDGKKKKITEDIQETLLEELENGFIVERHLINGDICIFNRQPSLHRMSIMCHRIKVLSGKSFRLNPSVCNPYNADFDGDEMNLHLPQTEEARAEAEILMNVQTQIITPKHGKNIIGCVHDGVTGNYLLTKEMNFTKEEAYEILYSIGINKFEIKKEKITGKEVFSYLLPKDFYYIGKTRTCRRCERCAKQRCATDSYVFIKKGKLESGIIDSNAIGEDSGVLIRDIYRKYGQEKTLEILNNIFKLGLKALAKRGFSTSLSDSDLPEEVSKEIKSLLKEAKRKVRAFIEEYEAGRLEILPGKTRRETLEVRILELLNKTRNKIGEIISETCSENNPTIILAHAGAVGNILNLAQMAAVVGQQSIRAKRIDNGYTDRTLSLFKKNDLKEDAHGFVRNSYRSGLNPFEFFFHAITGRDALMDTALRTPKSGYLYRRLANALQDIKIEYDGTVRDANKTIIQFKYGEDGIDVSRSEAGTLDVVKAIKDIVGD